MWGYRNKFNTEKRKKSLLSIIVVLKLKQLKAESTTDYSLKIDWRMFSSFKWIVLSFRKSTVQKTKKKNKKTKSGLNYRMINSGFSWILTHGILEFVEPPDLKNFNKKK